MFGKIGVGSLATGALAERTPPTAADTFAGFLTSTITKLGQKEGSQEKSLLHEDRLICCLRPNSFCRTRFPAVPPTGNSIAHGLVNHCVFCRVWVLIAFPATTFFRYRKSSLKCLRSHAIRAVRHRVRYGDGASLQVPSRCFIYISQARR